MTFKNQQSSGFTLIEIALVITLVAFGVAAATISFTHFSNEFKAQVTKDRMDKISNALAVYAQANYRIPCGAAPNATGAAQGTEMNNGQCFNFDAAVNNSLEPMGIVPWKVLGLSESDVVDGWGRYFTYKPSPHLTFDNRSTAMMTATNSTTNFYDVHDACRSAAWYDNRGDHINRAKAMFCCNAAPKAAYMAAIGLTNDISAWNMSVTPATEASVGVITDITHASQLPITSSLSNQWIEDQSSPRVDDFDRPMTQLTPRGQSAQGRTAGIAFGLVSHGANGKFSMLEGQPRNIRQAGTFNANTGALISSTRAGAQLEILNALPATAAIIDNPKAAVESTQGGILIDLTGQKDNASDDITFALRTDQLISRLGGNTCNVSANLAPMKSPRVNGVCGNAHGSTLFSAPSAAPPNPADTLCRSGTATSVGGAGPWTWQCLGSNGGTTVSCNTI